MIASNIVPRDTVIIDVIQKTKTRLLLPIDILLSIVRLGYLEMSSAGPWLISPCRRSGVGGSYLLVGSCPEPPIDIHRLQVRAVTTLEITNTARGPDIINLV